MQDRPLKFFRREPPAGRVLVRSGLQSIGDVVAVSLAILDSEHRAQSIAGLIEEHASEKMPALCSHAMPAIWCLGFQKCPSRGKGLVIEDGFVLAIVDAVLVPGLADINDIGEQVVKLAAREGHVAWLGR